MSTRRLRTMPPHPQRRRIHRIARQLVLGLCASAPLALPGEGARAVDLDDDDFAQTPA
jgi:hypothetical protein